MWTGGNYWLSPLRGNLEGYLCDKGDKWGNLFKALSGGKRALKSTILVSVSSPPYIA